MIGFPHLTYIRPQQNKAIMKYLLVIVILLFCLGEVQSQDADVIITIEHDTINCSIKKMKRDFIEYSVKGDIGKVPMDSVYFVNKQYWIDPRYYNDPLPLSFDSVQYSVVFYTDSVGFKVLYSKVYEWFETVFNTSVDVIHTANEETGVIVAKGTRYYSLGSRDVAINNGKSFQSEVRYTMKVECRENRYRVEMYDFIDSDLGVLTAQPIKKTDKRPHQYFAVFPLEIQNIYDDFFEKQWWYCKQDIQMFATSMIQSLEYATRDLKRQLNESDDW